MDELTQIITTLKQGEVRFIRKFYKVYGDGDAKKRLQLFNAVLNGEVKNDNDAAIKLYKSKPNSAFSHLKTRLKEDVLKILLLQDSSKKYESPFAQAEFDCRRYLIDGDLLLSRGAYLAAVKVLKKAAKLAEKYELVAEQVLIEDLLRSHLGFKKGIKSYKKYEESIHNKLKLFQEIITAKEYFNHLVLPNIFNINKAQSFKEFAFKATQKLKATYSRTKSPQIGYWYYNTAINYYLIAGSFVKALSFSKQLLRLVEKEPALYSNARRAGANMQIATVLIYLGEFIQSIKFAENAQQLFKTGMLNELHANEILFYAYFHSQDYVKAEKLLKRALKHPKLHESKIYPAKWHYYKANLEFAQSNYLQSLYTLQENSEIYKDKSGWLLGHKMLEIMTLIEMKNFDLVDYKLDSFRKLLQRQGNENIARCRMICQIFEMLSKENYNYDKVYKSQKARINQLQNGKKMYQRDLLGYEIVPFDQWLRVKSGNVNY